MSSNVLRSRAAKLAVAAVLTVVAAACGSSSPIAPGSTVVAEATAQSAFSASTRTAQAISAPSSAPIFLAGGPGTNYTCSDLAARYAPGATWFELKLDRSPQASESVSDGVLSVNITNGTSVSFDYSANRGIDAVFVKSGADGHHLYNYSPEAASGTGLTTPNSRQAISHISFCYDVELLVSKTAATTFTRDFDWTIAKSADLAAVTVPHAGSATVNYGVAIAKDAGTDSAWAVSGSIAVTNPHPSRTASGITVSDHMTDHGAVPVTCPSTSLSPLATMTCSYGSVSLASGAARTNTAAAASTSFGFAKGTGSADVTFVTPTTMLDNTVSISDTFPGAALANFPLATSRVFTYARTLSAPDFTACGAATTFDNTATLATDDGATASASASVVATLTCPPPPPVATGCTLTQGYWGTHSSKGPAKYDATWASLENAPFYQSGTTYYGVLQLATKGNAYYMLAHQFIAAKLNILKGAAAPAGFNMGAVETFFQTYTPAQIGAMKGGAPVRAQAIAWAATLDAYNNGLLNVSHCGS